MNSALCSILNIRYPIMQGAFQWLATPELAAAVSNAGGLGPSVPPVQDQRGAAGCHRPDQSPHQQPFCEHLHVPRSRGRRGHLGLHRSLLPGQGACGGALRRDQKPFGPSARGRVQDHPEVTAVRFAKKRRQRPGSMWCLWWALVRRRAGQRRRDLHGPHPLGGGCRGHPRHRRRRRVRRAQLSGHAGLGRPGRGHRYPVHGRPVCAHPPQLQAAAGGQRRALHHGGPTVHPLPPPEPEERDHPPGWQSWRRTDNPSLDDIFLRQRQAPGKKCYDSGDTQGGVFPCGKWSAASTTSPPCRRSSTGSWLRPMPLPPTLQ